MEGETVTTPVFRENPYKPRIFEGRYDPRGSGVIGENQKLYITMERGKKLYITMEVVKKLYITMSRHGSFPLETPRPDNLCPKKETFVFDRLEVTGYIIV